MTECKHVLLKTVQSDVDWAVRNNGYYTKNTVCTKCWRAIYVYVGPMATVSFRPVTSTEGIVQQWEVTVYTTSQDPVEDPPLEYQKEPKWSPRKAQGREHFSKAARNRNKRRPKRR